MACLTYKQKSVFHLRWLIIVQGYLLVYGGGLPQLAAQTPTEREVIRAEELVSKDRLDQAIGIYEQLIINEHQLVQTTGNDAQLGTLHLRAGQLYLKQMRGESRPEIASALEASASLHFLRCSQTVQLDPSLKDGICVAQVNERLSPLQIIGSAYQVVVRHPIAFQGLVKSGSLLPRGPVSLEIIRAPESFPEARVIQIPQATPIDLTERDFMPSRPTLSNPENFVLSHLVPPEQRSPKESSSIPSLPGYLMTGVGVVALSAWSILRFTKASAQFNLNNDDERISWFLISGAPLTVLGGAWLVWTW